MNPAEMSDISGLIQEYGPFILIAMALIILVAYLYLYLSRFFSYLKMKEEEDSHLNQRALDAILRYIKVIGIGLLLMAIVVVGQILEIEGLGDIFNYIRSYFFIFNGLVVLLVFAMLSLLGSSAVAKYRLKMDKDEKSLLKPGILEFYELFIKYGMYIFGLIVAILVAIVTIPDASTRSDIFDSLGLNSLDMSRIGTDLVVLVIVLAILFLMGKAITIILDDFKTRTKKFQPGLVDLIKTVIRYALYWVAFVITLTILLDIMNFAHLEIVMWFVVGLTLALIIIAGFSPVTRHAISGIALLTTDSINKGDWIQINDGKIGVVESQGLTITRLRTRTGDIIDLPNEMVLGSKVHNYTKLGGTLIRLAVKIDSSVPGQTVEKILLDIAVEFDQSRPDNPISPKVSVISLDSKSVEYNIDIWRKNPGSTEAITSEYLKKLKQRTSAEGVNILGTRLND